LSPENHQNLISRAEIDQQNAFMLLYISYGKLKNSLLFILSENLVWYEILICVLSNLTKDCVPNLSPSTMFPESGHDAFTNNIFNVYVIAKL
jgi:hypothetical protein